MNRLPFKIFTLCLAALFFAGCGGAKKRVSIIAPPVSEPAPSAPRMGYAIQAGAFSRLENAVRFTDSLKGLGLDAYYFLHESGLYKVRFGNYTSRDLSLVKAQELKANGLIEEFYIVTPEDYPWGRDTAGVDPGSTRRGIIQSAKSYIGIPYRFGGASPEQGFDCSGLAMAVYRLNGINLPRTSREQYKAGRAVNERDLKEADLVFFDTMSKGQVSHVGVYIGDGMFIHAPRSGQNIRIDSISAGYFKKRFIGARSFL
ncbi:MAG: hydrolase [Desulfatiglans sp.]|nr:hydrolase [Desulfatiglans sp.]